jgi:hypothetical protein
MMGFLKDFLGDFHVSFLGRVAGAGACFLFLIVAVAYGQEMTRSAADRAADDLPSAPLPQASPEAPQVVVLPVYTELQLLAELSQNPQTPSGTAPEKPAEKPAPAADGANPDAQKSDKPDDKAGSIADEDPPKRMFGMIPDFENTNNTPVNQKPLTVREKYVLAWHQSTDFSAHVGAAFNAGLQQWGDGQPRYGEGWGAYGKRFAAAEGDQMTSSWLIYGVFPSLLHDDPRYFRLGKGSPPVRVWYAITRTFVTRRDNGTQRFNYSTVSGQLVSCAISTAYYPEIDRAASRVFSNWGLDLVGFSAYNVLSEYYPDLIKALFHRGKNSTAGSGS